MFSDQGTNFVGAERELHYLAKDFVSDDRIKKKMEEEGLKWTFNAPASSTLHLTPLLPSEIPLEDISFKRMWLYLQSVMTKVWKRWQNE